MFGVNISCWGFYHSKMDRSAGDETELVSWEIAIANAVAAAYDVGFQSLPRITRTSVSKE